MPPIAAAWIAGISMLALVLFSPGMLNDGDTYTHIAAGDWMIAHRAVLHADPFSATRLGAPWVAHEWLSEILMAAAFRGGGWSGVVALTGLAAGTAFFQLGRHLLRSMPAGAALPVLVVAASCITPGMLARPHILALPVFEAWVAALFFARGRGVAPSWCLVPLMCLWANLHGGFVIGLALVVPLGLEAVLADPAQWRPVAARWGGFLLASVGACLLTPHGLAGLTLAFRMAGMAEISMIGEWEPANFSTLQPLELLVVIGLYAGLVRGVRLSVVRLLIVVVLLHLALQHARHLMLIGVIVPFLVAEVFSTPLRAARDRAAPWWYGGMVVAAVLVAVRLTVPVVRVDGASSPIAALAHVPAAMRGEPVLNDYAFGGYLIFAHVAPFIDARVELYKAAALRQYAAMTRPDGQVLSAVLRERAIGWTIFPPANPVVALLDATPGWCRTYADGVAVVHARCAGEPHRTPD